MRKHRLDQGFISRSRDGRARLDSLKGGAAAARVCHPLQRQLNRQGQQPQLVFAP